MFSMSQCLSVMMWWHTPAGMGSTTMVVSDCRLLMQSTGIASAEVVCTDEMIWEVTRREKSGERRRDEEGWDEVTVCHYEY